MDSYYRLKGNVARIFLKEKKKTTTTLFWFTVVRKEDPHNWNIMSGKLNVLKKKSDNRHLSGLTALMTSQPQLWLVLWFSVNVLLPTPPPRGCHCLVAQLC